MHIEYELSIDLNEFLENDLHRKIISERLTIDGEKIFSRCKKLSFGGLLGLERFFPNEFIENFEEKGEFIKRNLEENLADDSLFLTGGFGGSIASRLTEIILNWISKKFIIIYRIDSVASEPHGIIKNIAYVDEFQHEALSCFGNIRNEVAYIKKTDDDMARMYSVVKNSKEDKVAEIPAEIFESFGTVRFMEIFPLILNTIRQGGVLAID